MTWSSIILASSVSVVKLSSAEAKSSLLWLDGFSSFGSVSAKGWGLVDCWG